MYGFLKDLASRRNVITRELSGHKEAFLLDEEELRHLQKVLLNMYKDIYAVCMRYGIIPYLTGGSALGAVRHQGFIPWDDDLDVGMTREDYYVFRAVFKKELGDKYILNAPNYCKNPKARFPKVLKKGTICRGIDDYSDDEDCGIFIDIFIIENVPNNAVIRMAKGIICNGLEFIGGQVSLYENKNELVHTLTKQEGSAVSFIRKSIGCVFGQIKASSWYHGIDKAVRWNGSSDLVSLPTGRGHYFGEIIPSSVIGPPRYITFCDIEAPVFCRVEEYLYNLYGKNYMQLPPKEKRERHYLTDLRF